MTMATLNITYQGQSADYELALDFATSDADIRRIAVELVRSGGVRGLYLPQLPNDAFASFVVDRLTGPRGEQRIYLRPKVPFGAVARR
jgi:hypothetical protein